MEYNVVDTEDVPVTDLSTVDEMPPDLDIRAIDETLECQNIATKIWYFDEGEEIKYHAHSEQEELFYVLEGTFSLKLGQSGEEEYIEVDEGAFWVAAPKIGHGHRCISEDGGAVLALGAPPVEDPGLDPHSLADEEIDDR
ncbi:cupin domain-containing protein [Natronococcus pandeyae]|uniref:Cupin domain-containing protein n=1 Tax=Natronococcus pandeyae TaxID=2055836 RepID=A0A8J8PYS5_9EURY|nr:cupin domain-containing protein [Natronococcus pandeyae]TYL37346.1 cupin domain-containing protein [Natronococcus pandeyae]